VFAQSKFQHCIRPFHEGGALTIRRTQRSAAVIEPPRATAHEWKPLCESITQSPYQLQTVSSNERLLSDLGVNI
ncbi:hypothetical protein, partial [Niveibacterium sp.]|uniref:hypothetical protein n=1 Tax=Niveibacterium sp. TaxID=2017444 RepID=UPI0035B1E0F7